MVLWIFGYGSLVWKAGFEYDVRKTGYIKGYKRVFYQECKNEREGFCQWGAAYCIEGGKDAEETAKSYLEVREKQYDVRAYVDLFTKDSGGEAVVWNVLVYVASSDMMRNPNYLGPAPLHQIARQIAESKGPSGPNFEYVFRLEQALQEMGGEDAHVQQLSDLVRTLLGTSQGRFL